MNGDLIAEIWGARAFHVSASDVPFGTAQSSYGILGCQLLFVSFPFFLLPKIDTSTILRNLLTERGCRFSTPLPKGFGAPTLCICDCHIRMEKHLQPRPQIQDCKTSVYAGCNLPCLSLPDPTMTLNALRASKPTRSSSC